MPPAQGSTLARADSFRSGACVLLAYACVLSRVAVAVRLDVIQGRSHAGSHEYGSVADTFAQQPENHIDYYDDIERIESFVASSSIPLARTKAYFDLPKKTFPVLSSTGDGKLKIGKGTAAVIAAINGAGSGKQLLEGGLGGQTTGGDLTVGTVSASAASQAAETISKLVGELQLRVPVSRGDAASVEPGGVGSDELYALLKALLNVGNHNVETQRILSGSKERSKDIRATVPLPTPATTVGNATASTMTAAATRGLTVGARDLAWDFDLSEANDTALDRNSSALWNSVVVEHERELIKDGEAPTLGILPRENETRARIAYCRRTLIAASRVLDHLEHDCGSARNQKEAALASTEADPAKTVMDALSAKFKAASGDFSFGSSLLDDAHVLSRDIAETDFGFEMKNEDTFKFEEADEEEEIDAYDVDGAKGEAVMPESAEKHVRWEEAGIHEALGRMQNGLWDQANPGRLIVQSAVETESSLRKRLRAYQALRNGGDALLKQTIHASSNAAVKEELLSIAVGDTCHKKLMTRKWLKQEVRQRCPGSNSLSAASLVQLGSYIEEEVDVDGAAGASKNRIPSDLPSGLLQHGSKLELQTQSHQQKDEQHVKLLPNASFHQTTASDVAVRSAVVENTSASSVLDTMASSKAGNRDSSEIHANPTWKRPDAAGFVSTHESQQHLTESYDYPHDASLGDTSSNGIGDASGAAVPADNESELSTAVEQFLQKRTRRRSGPDAAMDDGSRYFSDDYTIDVMTHTEVNEMVRKDVPPADAADDRIAWVLANRLDRALATPVPTPAFEKSAAPTPLPTQAPTIEPTQAELPAVVPPSELQTTTHLSANPRTRTSDDGPTTTTSMVSASEDGAVTTTAGILTRRDGNVGSLASRHATEEYHWPGYESLLRTAVDQLQKDRHQKMKRRKKLHNRDHQAETGQAAMQDPELCNAMTCDRECFVQQGAQFQTSTCRSRIVVHQETKSLKEAVDVVNKKCYTQCCCTMMEVERQSSLLAPRDQFSEFSRTKSASATADYETAVETAEVPASTLMSRDELLSQIRPWKEDRDDEDVPAQEQDRLLDTDAWAGSRGRGKGRRRAAQKRSTPTVLSTHARKHRHHMRRKSRPEVHRKRRHSRQSSLDVMKFGKALATALLATQEDAKAPDSKEKERLAYIQEFLALTDMTDSKGPRRPRGNDIVRRRLMKDDYSASLLDQPMKARRLRPADSERAHAASPAEAESVEWCNSRGYLLDEIENDLRVRCPQAVMEDSSLGQGGSSVVSGDQCLARENRFEKLLNRISAECSECPRVMPGRCDEKCAGRSRDGVDFVSTCRSLVLSVSLDGPQGMSIETAICDVNRLCASQCGCSKQDFLDDTSSNAGEVSEQK
eukprot:TRINITY_DN3429_c2_g1_i1.p1 TRINITY_DN3429_c2_g1~~TRINITY_DN3429_c2_g1_i1.p1  ORF type:complete len:1402 (-),score=235.48 TRINITY_DN3429_c2_g1_i1:40-4158(-)